MASSEFDIHHINYIQLRQDIADRLAEIKAMSIELSQNITTDEDMALLVIPEFHERAAVIAKDIADMRLENQHAAAYINFSIDIMKKYNIRISLSNDSKPLHANIDGVIIHENQHLQATIESLKRDFSNEKIKSAKFEKEKKQFETLRENRIREIQSCQSELKQFIETLSSGAGAAI